MNIYRFQPDSNFLKQGFFMEDENKNKIMEAIHVKQSIFTASEFKFVNNRTGKEETHKVGKTGTWESSGLFPLLSIKSSFKFDDKDIWKLIHEKGIKIESKIAISSIGMEYDIIKEGKVIGSATTAHLGIIPTPYVYDVLAEDDYLEDVFLIVFAIARTDQVLYS